MDESHRIAMLVCKFDRYWNAIIFDKNLKKKLLELINCVIKIIYHNINRIINFKSTLKCTNFNLSSSTSLNFALRQRCHN